jgi:ethanolamine utilization cobalamin adenosyltransferase
MTPEEMRREGLILETFNVNKQSAKNIVMKSANRKGWIGFIAYYTTNEYEVFSRRNLMEHYNTASSTIYVETPRRSLMVV